MNAMEEERRPPRDPSGVDEPHDVLAAEEFGMPTREERYPSDPTGIQKPHDVLAAEEFAMPTRDARYAADPSGIHEPHDVLAAEEFAMPGGGRPSRTASRGARRRNLPPLLLGLGLALIVLRRRRA